MPLLFSHFKEPKLPLVDLHVHAEAGIMDEKTVRMLAAKHGLLVKDEDRLFKKGLISPGEDFFDFLRIYDKVSSYVRDEADVVFIISQYLAKCAKDGAIYVEMIISPMHYTPEFYKSAGVEYSGPGLPYPDLVNAVAEGIDKAKAEHGIEARMTMCLVRNNPEQCNTLIETIVAHPHPYVRGINLAGDDVNYPAQLFSEYFKKAKQAGLKATAHVGEHTPAHLIREEIETLGLDRIGHGNAASEDESLLKYFQKNGLRLELCPSSNVDGGLYKNMAAHPIGRIARYDMRIPTINTDDPTFALRDSKMPPITLKREYERVQRSHHFTIPQMLQFCRNAVESSFAEECLKQALLKKVDAYQLPELRRSERIKDKLHATHKTEDSIARPHTRARVKLAK